jgi:hypothetical protein
LLNPEPDAGSPGFSLDHRRRSRQARFKGGWRKTAQPDLSLGGQWHIKKSKQTFFGRLRLEC